ncbi:hypothetical protein [Alkaliflexus imshenetskii]|uniref:hypothetical protein n=1 Tax=Alkaliflexus imshenetskii TaxID=286730 RepID=UPI0004B06432|nr:hypothetical protein [Alkaliflexus imshenetskii]
MLVKLDDFHIKVFTNSSIVNKVCLLSLIMSLLGCVNSREKDIRNCLNNELYIENIDSVYHNQKLVPYLEFRKEYNYIYVVYLQDDCTPCYYNYLEWSRQMSNPELETDRHTVLFIIASYNYDDFIRKINKIEEVNNDFYIAIDPNFYFIDKNNNIPRWIIDASVLIDSENKIKMVGAPWINEDMQKLFHKTVNSK